MYVLILQELVNFCLHFSRVRSILVFLQVEKNTDGLLHHALLGLLHLGHGCGGNVHWVGVWVRRIIHTCWWWSCIADMGIYHCWKHYLSLRESGIISRWWWRIISSRVVGHMGLIDWITISLVRNVWIVVIHTKIFIPRRVVIRICWRNGWVHGRIWIIPNWRRGMVVDRTGRGRGHRFGCIWWWFSVVAWTCSHRIVACGVARLLEWHFLNVRIWILRWV